MKKPQQLVIHLALWLLGLSLLHAYDIPGYTPDQIVEYKRTTNSSGGAVGLDLHIFTPDGHQTSDSRPTIVFFFGGGWNSGSASHFHPHCEYLASRGMVAISAEYRVKNFHGTSPQECVKDGKSAVRWIRENATTLGVDPNRIAAGGGSAGGHVAAAAGTLSAYEEPGENLAISSKPNALVLFNPVYDNGPTGYGYSRVQAYWEDISPLHNIDATAPPTVVYLGTNDSLIPVATAENYKALMEAQGHRCDLHLYEGQPHSFFNFDVPGDSSGPFYGYQSTVFRMDEFLVSLGYLTDPYDTPIPVEGWVTIFGDAGFSGDSAAGASPVTTDANADCIAANFDPVNLADGEFIRLTGTVTFDEPIPGGHFRVGLFDGDGPVLAGDGNGFTGLWSEAPSTTAARIAAGDGSGSDHPFESINASDLGPMPATAVTARANRPVDFNLMIARNGTQLDISASFSDGGTYLSEQNLLNLSIADYSFDSVAFLMTGILNGTEGNYSNIAISTGTVLPAVEPPLATLGPITFVDAVEGGSGNTFATGGSLENTSWTGAGSTQWEIRSTIAGANGGELFQSGGVDPVELNTQITGLPDGTYEIWAFYWDQIDSDSNNWMISAGLTSGSLTSYSSPGEPAVSPAITTGVTYAGDLNFTTSVTVDGYNSGNPTLLRQLFGVNLGQVQVSGDSAVNVYVDNLINGNSAQDNRTWYDGVGYTRVNNFDNWISGFDVGLMKSSDDDPDGDGNSSGLENFLGTNPAVADAVGLSAMAASAEGGNTFIFAHPQNANPANDLAAAYQWSTDLADFHDNGLSNSNDTTVSFEALTDTPTPGITTVTATINGAIIPDTLFVRLKVTQTGS